MLKISNNDHVQQIYMKTFFFALSVFLVIAWAISYFVYAIQDEVHFLLFFALLIGLAGTVKKN